MGMSKLPIKYGKWGIANNMGDYVLLHEKLKSDEYANLRIWLIKHELKHKPGKFGYEDFKLDVADSIYKPKQVSWAYLKFFFTTPSAWVQILPIWIYDGVVWIEFVKLYSMLFYMAMIYVGWRFLKWLIF